MLDLLGRVDKEITAKEVSTLRRRASEFRLRLLNEGLTIGPLRCTEPAITGGLGEGITNFSVGKSTVPLLRREPNPSPRAFEARSRRPMPETAIAKRVGYSRGSSQVSLTVGKTLRPRPGLVECPGTRRPRL